MKLLELIIFLYWHLGSSVGLIVPISSTNAIIKSGGDFSLEFVYPKTELANFGAELSITSMILKGTGNSYLKVISISPELKVPKSPIFNIFTIKGRLNFSRITLENPFFTDSFWAFGYGGALNIHLLSKPLPLAINMDYVAYPGGKKALEWLKLGLLIEGSL